jgi:hypothetical protein
MPSPKDKTTMSDKQFDRLLKELKKRGLKVVPEDVVPKKEKKKPKKSKVSRPSKKESKNYVPIVFEEESPKGVRLDRLADLFPKKSVDIEFLEESETLKEHSPTQCIAITKKGDRCRNRTKIGDYCGVHRKAFEQEQARKEEERKLRVKKIPITKTARTYEITFTCYGRTAESSLLHPKMKKKRKTKVKNEDPLIEIKSKRSGNLIFEDQEEFVPLSKSIAYTITTKRNLLKLYPDGKTIEHYKDKKGGALQSTREWDSFLLLTDNENGFTRVFGSMLDSVRYIIIDQISLDSVSSGYTADPLHLHKKKNYGKSFFHRLNTSNYDVDEAKEDLSLIFVPQWRSEFLKENWIPDRCIYDVVIENHETSYNKEELKKAKNKNRPPNTLFLTYEHLEEKFGFHAGMTIPDLVDKWCRVMKVDLYVYDLTGKLDTTLSYNHDNDQELRVLPNGKTTLPTLKNKHINNSVHITVANGHVQLIIDNLHSLCCKDSSTDDMDEPLKVSSHFNVPSTQAHTKDVILETWTDIKSHDLLQHDDSITTLRFIVPETLESILWCMKDKYNYIPKISSTNRDKVNIIHFSMQHFQVEIVNPECDVLLGMLKFDNQKQYDRFSEMKTQFHSVVMDESHKSSFTYNTMSYNYCAKPLIYCTDKSIIPNCKVDISKAYPWALSKIRTISTFNGYDDWKEFPDGSLIEATNNYIIQRKDNDQIPNVVRLTFLVQRTTELRGTEIIQFTQKYINWREYFTITRFRVPSQIDRDCREITNQLETIFNDPVLSEMQKKFISVCTTGIIEKTKNKLYATLLVDDGHEASYYAKKYNTHAFQIERPIVINTTTSEMPLLKESNKDSLWKLTIGAEKELENGFYPIKVAIYSVMRMYLLEICEKIEKMGGVISGFRVDCIYFNLDSNVSLPPVPKKNPVLLFQSLGVLKWERMGEDDTYPINEYKDKTADVIEIVHEPIKSNEYVLKTEKNWRSDNDSYVKEAVELTSSLFTAEKNRLLIEANIGGAGKTFLALKIGEHFTKMGKNVHLAVQNNFRINELQEETSLPVSTLETILNVRVDNGHVVKCRSASKVDINSIDILLIDEIFYHDIPNQECMRQLFVSHPTLHVIGMGDHVQSRVNKYTNNVKEDPYWSGVVRSVFHSIITLNENKRLIAEDIPKMLEIKDYLVNRDIPKNRLVVPHIKTVDDIEFVLDHSLDENGKPFSRFITYTNETANVLNKMMHERVIAHPSNKNLKITKIGGMKLWIGLTLRNRVHTKIGKEKLNVNYIYKVIGFSTRSHKGIDFTAVEITDGKSTYFIPPSSLKNFVYGYACTALSSQGCTYKDCPIIIFDCFHYRMKNKDIYTSILRTNRLDNVSIYVGPALTVEDLGLSLRIENRILSHQAEDTKKGRLWEQGDYVDEEWVMTEFDETSCVCPWCRQVYSLSGSDHQTWSIDRLDDRFAHTKRNSVIAHRSCNIGMAKNKSLFLHL